MKNKPIKVMWPKKINLEQWESLRKEMEGIGNPDVVRIGASDIGTILEPSKWKCPRRLAIHLVGQYSYFEITDATLDGVLQEPLIASMWESWDEDYSKFRFQAQNRIKVRSVKKAQFFLLNNKYPNLFVSLDFIPKDSKQYSPFTGEKLHPLTPHEVKLTGQDYYRHWSYKGYPITAAYYAQLQSQLLVSGATSGIFLVKIRETGKFIATEIPRDDEFIEYMIAKVSEFVEVVKKAKQAYYEYLAAINPEEKELLRQIYELLLPPYGGTEDDVALADELWEPPIDPDASLLLADDQLEYLMKEYVDYGFVEKTVKEEKNKIRAQLKQAASGFEGIRGQDYKAIIRGQRSDRGSYFKVDKIK